MGAGKGVKVQEGFLEGWTRSAVTSHILTKSLVLELGCRRGHAGRVLGGVEHGLGRVGFSSVGWRHHLEQDTSALNLSSAAC